MDVIFETKTSARGKITEDKPLIFILVATIAIFLLSFALFIKNYPGVRRIFLFESVDSGKLCMETRYLPKKSFEESVKFYVDELLLGPMTERCKPIFSLGTTETFCFVRNDVLYVNLTKDVLERNGGASKIMAGIELFKKNIKKTFKKINSVEMYIDDKFINN